MVLSADQVLYVGERFGVAEIRNWNGRPQVREINRMPIFRSGAELDRLTFVPALERELLKDADAKVRIAAADILGWTDPTSVTALTAALDDPDSSVQAKALESLWELESLAKPATESVLRLTKSPNEQIRWRAISACGWIRIEPDKAVPILLAATKDESTFVRFRAAESLQRLKVASAEVVTALAGGLADEDWDVRNMCAEALGNMGEPAVSALILATTHPKAEARRYAASALLSIGPKAKAAIPALEAMNKDPDMEAGAMAARALRAIKGLPEPEHNGGRVTFPRN
jgi:HEAT repeat protein